MSQQHLNAGTNPNDHTGDPIRSIVQKAEQNFTELYGAVSDLGDGVDSKAPIANPAFTGSGGIVGDWTFGGSSMSDYTPTVGSTGGALTSYTVNFAKFKKIGKIVLFAVSVSITNQGTASGGILVGLPSTANGSPVFAGRETAATGKMLQGYINSPTNMQVRFYDNSFAGATGNTLVVSGWYSE